MATDSNPPRGANARPAGTRRGALAPSLGRALRSLEAVLVVAGVGLLLFYAAARIHAFVGRAEALEAFEVAQLDHATVAAASPNAAAPDQALWGKNRIAAYHASLKAAVGTPLGVLAIPKIGLTVPIFEGTAELVLNRGVGRIEGTAKLDERGNLGIAGHRDGFFRGLKDVAVGDAIEVQSLSGLVRYRIAEISIVEPSDVYVLDPTDEATLTLVTCYPFYFVGDAPQRYIVKATALAAPPAGRSSG